MITLRHQYARINAAYADWLAAGLPSPRPQQKPECSPTAPLISVIMPVCDVEERYLAAAINSVRDQTFPHWELRIVDDASTRPGIRPLLERYAHADPRIQVEFRERRGHISAASNQAVAAARGEFVALLDHDDRLTLDALESIAQVIAKRPDVDFIYSDEDKLDPAGRRIEPFFKPAWSPALLTCCNYITHLAALRRTLVQEVGGFRDEMVGSQDHDLFLRAGERARVIAHIPRVLYSWRMTAQSTASASSAKPYAIAAARRALQDTIKRRDWDAELQETNLNGLFAIRQRVTPSASLSLIVHGRGTAWRAILAMPALRIPDLVFLDPAARADQERTLDGWVSGTRMPRVVDRIEDLSGEYFLWLDAESVPTSSGAVLALLEPLAVPDIAAAGGLTIHRRSAVAQAGIVLDANGQAEYAYAGVPLLPHPMFYLNLKLLIREVAAVPTSCCATRACTWRSLGGWRDDLPPDLALVDLCLRAGRRGLRIIATPLATFARATPLPPLPRVSQHAWSWTAADDQFSNPNLTPGSRDGLPLRDGRSHPPRVRPAEGTNAATVCD